MICKQSALLLGIVVSWLGSPLAAEEGGSKALEEPEKLTKLRESWQSAKVRESRPIREKYLATLEELKTKLTKQERLEGALEVRGEIEALKSADPERVDVTPLANDIKLAELVGLRKGFERDMSGVIEKNDTIYRRELKKLKASYSKLGDLNSSLAVDSEMKKVKAQEDEVPQEELPKNKRELEEFLINTEWNLRKPDGNPDGKLRFQDKGVIFMPWHECTWHTRGDRKAMMNNGNDWSFSIEFSEDLRKVEVFKQSGKIAWEGEFLRRKEIEAD